MNVLTQFDTVGQETTENAYMPYLVALENGIIENPEDKARLLSEPPGVSIANGLIPNTKGAGIIAVGDSFGAFDLSRVAFEDKTIEVTPSPKTAVEHDTGRITQEGGIVLELGDGRIQLVGVAIDIQKQPWLAHDLLKDHIRFVAHHIAVVALCCLDVPEYEIIDVDTTNGAIRAKERIRIFSV